MSTRQPNRFRPNGQNGCATAKPRGLRCVSASRSSPRAVPSDIWLTCGPRSSNPSADGAGASLAGARSRPARRRGGQISRYARQPGNRIARRNITVHISPYENGMAPETYDFVAELNAEAERLKIGVSFFGLKNRIEVTGDIQDAAGSPSLVGWFFSRAQKVGFFEGEYGVLRRGNF